MIVSRNAVFACALLTPLIGTPTQAADEDAKLASRSWESFKCAAWAGASANQDEKARLFKIGFDKGLAFLYAVKTGAVTKAQISEMVPWAYATRLEDHPPHFILGMVWEAAVSEAMEPVMKDGGQPAQATEWKSRAERLFSRANCSLL
ncbi:hypothetical protein [Sinorhizobium fredii]